MKRSSINAIAGKVEGLAASPGRRGRIPASAVLATVLVPGLTCLPAVGQAGVKPASPAGSASQSKPEEVKPAVAPAKPVDADLLLAQALLDKALFLRNFYAANDLSYDAAGHLQGSSKPTDWTLAAVTLQKLDRRSPTQIELTGVRVAIRYNEDAHEFQRHNQADQKVKILLTDPGHPQGFSTALETIFAIGIDPALQRSMPDYWRHYFDPGLAWPTDALSSQTIESLGGTAPSPPASPNQPRPPQGPLVPPRVEHKAEATYTPAAEHDKVHGVMQLRLVVDNEGLPRRIAITKPLGYGLDERAVEAAQKMRFSPATRGGTPVPAAMLINQDFIVVQTPHP